MHRVLVPVTAAPNKQIIRYTTYVDGSNKAKHSSKNGLFPLFLTIVTRRITVFSIALGILGFSLLNSVQPKAHLNLFFPPTGVSHAYKTKQINKIFYITL